MPWVKPYFLGDIRIQHCINFGETFFLINQHLYDKPALENIGTKDNLVKFQLLVTYCQNVIHNVLNYISIIPGYRKHAFSIHESCEQSLVGLDIFLCFILFSLTM